MTLRQLCRNTQIPSMALYHFVAEEKTGIAPTRLVVEKDRVAVGNLVTVNWEGARVPATILALSDNSKELNEMDLAWSKDNLNSSAEPLKKKPRSEKKTAEVAKKAKAKEGKKKQDKSKTNKKPHATKKDECRVLIAIDPASPQVISDQEEIEQDDEEFRPGCTSTPPPPTSPPPPPPPSPPTSWLPAVPNLPAQSLLGELMDEDLREFSHEQKLNRLLDNQEATLKLMAKFMRETREFRELVTNFMRESRERKCCGCRCVKERVRVSPKPCSGRLLTTISTGDLRDSAVGDFGDGAVGDFGDGAFGDFGDGMAKDSRDDAVRDLRDDAIASGSSNLVGDSGNMEQFGEEGDGFLQEAVQIKSGSSSVGNFAKNVVETIFQPGELEGRNCSGTRGKMLLDKGKLGIVRKYVFKLYPCGQAQEDAQWRKCIVAIDEFLRRAKGKGNRQQ